MSTDLSQYQTLFIQTSTDLVNRLLDQLSILEKDLHNKEAITILHRSAHSLKSQSLVMGFTQLGTVNRQLEALFLDIKENKIKLTGEYIKMVTHIVQHIKNAIADIENSENEPNLRHDIELLKKHTNI